MDIIVFTRSGGAGNIVFAQGKIINQNTTGRVVQGEQLRELMRQTSFEGWYRGGNIPGYEVYKIHGSSKVAAGSMKIHDETTRHLELAGYCLNIYQGTGPLVILAC